LQVDAVGQAKAEFVEGMGRVADFWGVGKVMGRLWAVLYLNPEPMTMDELTAAVGITKGHTSTNLRALIRVGLVQKGWKANDRKDYYSAETDLWAFVKGFLRVRQNQEFEQALGSTVRALAFLEQGRAGIPAAEYAFLQRRLNAIRDFHSTIDRGVQALLRLDDVRTAITRLAPGRTGARTGSLSREQTGLSDATSWIASRRRARPSAPWCVTQLLTPSAPGLRW
jgi:DNA-binding transcriptional regulator GbsR (MarR family)